jgi:outer membrane protein assembly factor BamC
MHPVTRSPSLPALAAFAALASLSLAGCSSLDSLISGDKIDYRSSSNNKTAGLEVPPDLTQLTRDSRYQQTQGSSVSAAAFQAAAPASASASASASTITTTTAAVQAATVALQSVGEMRIERLGNERWLRTSIAPEQLWPQLQAFWKERGFVLTQDVPAAGVMETDWAENRGKLPLDFVRASIGKIFDGAYSTGELDKFRTRVERSAEGTEVYITHRGMIEVYRGERQENTVWQPRAPDPQLEGELLSRLMLKLGAREELAKTAAAAPGAPAAPGAIGPAARARLLADRPTPTLQVDDGFDRAWRRVGVALDRSGFTVEDRDRTQGVYFVRYIDPAFAGKEEPNLFAKLFSFGKKDDAGSPTRYRVTVKSEGDSSTVSVFDGKGAPDAGDAGKRITKLLLEDLK